MASILVKPHYGAPCNNCGLCCLAAQCNLSRILFGQQVLCPALLDNEEGGGVCGVIADPVAHVKAPGASPEVIREAVAVVTGAGLGCDAEYADENPILVAHHRARFRQAAIDNERTVSPEARRVINWLKIQPR